MIFASGVAWLVAFSAIALGMDTSGQPRGMPGGKEQSRPLCEALQSVGDGQSLPLVVSGIYAVNYEMSVLYDPRHPLCEEDVQPSTWIEFGKGAENRAQLSRTMGEDHRAYVTLEGVLFGPAPLQPENPAVPLALRLPLRLEGRRYGHQNGFRTKFVANRVLEARRVPKSVPWDLVWYAPESPKNVREPLGADVPYYPRAACLAGLEGEVDVEVTLASGKIVATQVVSGAPALAAAAIANIGTWKFPPDSEGSFTAHFSYELKRARSAEPKHTLIELSLPTRVKITAPRCDW